MRPLLCARTPQLQTAGDYNEHGAGADFRLLSPSSLVRDDQHACARGDAVDQPQRCLRATGKQPPSTAQYERSNHQQILVDQIGGHQRADQDAATHDHEIRGRALLELGHGGRNVAMQQSRVRPVEPRCRVARGDVLVNAIERVLERAAPAVPGGQELLVGAPPKQPHAIPPIRSPILATVASSPYGIPQPPSANPSRVSSSGRPGPCITPSSVTQFITITFPISSPLLLPSHLLFFSHLISCSSPISSPVLQSRRATHVRDRWIRKTPGLFRLLTTYTNVIGRNRDRHQSLRHVLHAQR